jgi:hypothetical protein
MDRDKTGEVIVTKADEDAIREIELRFNEAWGRHDADGMIESLVDIELKPVNPPGRPPPDEVVAWVKQNAVPLASTEPGRGFDEGALAGDVAFSRRTWRSCIRGSTSTATSTRQAHQHRYRVVRKLDGRWRTVAVRYTDLRPGAAAAVSRFHEHA